MDVTRTDDLVMMTHPPDMAWLVSEVTKLPAGSTLLELGAFVLGSAVAMARANPQITVHAVDTGWLNWLDNPNHPAVRGLNWRYPDIQFSSRAADEIRQRQLSTVRNVVYHQGWSRSFIPSPAPTLCFIDADHSTSEVIADFFHCWSVAAQGAMIVGDDIQMPTVQKAVDHIAQFLGCKPTYAAERLWYWHKDLRF